MFKYIFLLTIWLSGCFTRPGKPIVVDYPESSPPSHELWNELLSVHVSEDGRVNYKGFIADSAYLNRYLEDLTTHPPSNSWSRNEQLAYWINAYNAFTVQLIIRHYPVKSIKEIKPKGLNPLSGPWHIRFVKIGDQTLTLDEVEHNILRPIFEEPRIHFAINCASVSCPVLRDEAFVASKLEDQLNDQTIRFLNDPVRNRISIEQAFISKIFSWFEADFTKVGSLRDFLNRYSPATIRPDTPVNFLEYDWRLNE